MARLVPHAAAVGSGVPIEALSQPPTNALINDRELRKGIRFSREEHKYQDYNEAGHIIPVDIRAGFQR